MCKIERAMQTTYGKYSEEFGSQDIRRKKGKRTNVRQSRNVSFDEELALAREMYEEETLC